MNDLTLLLLQYYGIANYNMGVATIEKMIIIYNAKNKQQIPLDGAWCAILLFNMCKILKYDIGTANAWVATWMNIGTQIIPDDAKLGDLVIVGNLVNQSHITTFVRWSSDGAYAYCLGGNQGEQLNIAPFSKQSIARIIRLNKINS